MRPGLTTIFLVRSGQTRRNDIPAPRFSNESLIGEGVEVIISASRALSRVPEKVEAIYSSAPHNATKESARLIAKYAFPLIEIRYPETEMFSESTNTADYNPYLDKLLSKKVERLNLILGFKEELDKNNIKTAILVDDGKLIKKILVNNGFISRFDDFKIKPGSVFKCAVVSPLATITKIIN